jgi:hypothetical protein
MECPICKELFKGEDRNIIVIKHNTDKTVACSKKRGHFFHRDCMIKWDNKTCPLDRDPFTRMYNIDYRVMDGLDLRDFHCYYVLIRDIKISDDVIKSIKNINNQDEKGKTLFYLACQYGNLKLVKKLIKIGADPLISNNDNFTPLMISICNFNKDIFLYLLKNKEIRLSINIVDKKGFSAFDYAARLANISAIREILGYYIIDIKTIQLFLLHNQKHLITKRNGPLILDELYSYSKLLFKKYVKTAHASPTSD